MNKSINDIDFEKSGGLVPIIVQDANTKDILTLAYANKESLELAKKTGNSWFWSRSRNKLWMKGEESGNTQKIKEILGRMRPIRTWHGLDQHHRQWRRPGSGSTGSDFRRVLSGRGVYDPAAWWHGHWPEHCPRADRSQRWAHLGR